MTRTAFIEHFARGADSLERWFDKERDQLPLWVPVGLGIGICFWDTFGNQGIWYASIAAAVLIFCGFLVGTTRKAGAFIRFCGVAVILGFLCIMTKSWLFGAVPLEKMQIIEFYGRIAKVEPIAARDIIRLKLETDKHAGLPAIVRVNLTPEQYRPDYTPGAILRLRARLVPPAQPALPSGYDFARRAWFSEIGATGTALGDLQLYKPARSSPILASARQKLSTHIQEKLPGASGTIAAALATGDQGAILEDDAQAMRDSGMAHLLSISGLHVTAVVGAIFLLVSKVTALSSYVALRLPVPIIAACAAAAAAIGYTLLTGSEVPTIRSCVAAILILIALILGRDALSLRLIAFGATIILIFWPESLAGPSFQLSFAAVATIIILHDTKFMRKFSSNPQDNWPKAIFRNLVMLLITGVAIEFALVPIALYHFHKTGLYGALANIVAIPLTTFVTMPAEALALLLDLAGLGEPFWWITGISIDIILVMAHYISALPGAISMLPPMPSWAFAIMVFGFLSMGLLKTRLRYAGVFPFIIGYIAMLTAPNPDILITGDGKHLALVNKNGSIALLRNKAGEYVRDTLSENAGIASEPLNIEDWPETRCTLDSCVMQVGSNKSQTTILALRSRYRIPAMELAAACKRADLVVSERWLPASCKPRWLKLDRRKLNETGGIAIYLSDRRVVSVAEQSPNAPWNILRRQTQDKIEAERNETRKLIFAEEQTVPIQGAVNKKNSLVVTPK